MKELWKNSIIAPSKQPTHCMTDFWAKDDEPKECLWTGDSVDGKINWVNDLGHKMENCDDPYWLDTCGKTLTPRFGKGKIPGEPPQL